MTWDSILDSEIAAYAPVTGRLMTKYRNNLNHARWCTFQGFPITRAIGSGASWATFETLRFMIPDTYVGDATETTRVKIRCVIEYNDNGTLGLSAQFRLSAGGNNGTEAGILTVGSGTTDTSTIEIGLDWSPTTDAIASVNVQKTADAGFTVLNWIWKREHADNYLQALVTTP